MELELSAEEKKGLDFVCGSNERMREVMATVAGRQRGSIEWHRRGLASVSCIPSQLPYEAPILPLCVDRAKGSRIVDIDGREYIDCHMCYAASILGHNPDVVEHAIQEMMGRGLGAGYFFKEQIELAELVRQVVPGLERVAFFHSGTDSVTASIRLARAATQRTLVAKFEGCYHGWNDVGLYNTIMALSGSLPSEPVDRIKPLACTGGVTPAPASEFLILPYNSPIAFKQIRDHAAELACVLVNPVPPFMSSWIEDAKTFVSKLRAITAEVRVPLIFDEVVTGFRLSRGGAQEALDVQADMACYGKITSALGIPLSMVGGKARFVDAARTDGLLMDHHSQKAWVSSTYASNFLAVVSCLAQLRYLTDNFDSIVSTLDRNYAHLNGELCDFAQRNAIPVSIQGHPRLQSMISLAYTEPAERTYRVIMSKTSMSVYRALLALTFYLRLHGIYTKTMPSINLSAAHTDEDVEIITTAIKKSLLKMQQDGMLPS